MNTGDNIFFVGLMGAGKTTIGRLLAKRLGKRFADADHEIEARTGVRVPLIFEIEGEDGFRRREAQVIEELVAEHDLVLATGGGVILNPDNRRQLAANGLVIYLCATPQTLYERTRHDKNRPLLQVDNPRAKIEALYVQRDPLYREVADLIVNGDGRTAQSIVKFIEKEIAWRCAHSK